ncbi:DUF1264 domain-containing protein [Aeoliella sp.]|uniref:DUF1264 domain-containing protein n=1 Tax=Aeoliella sp. TaxID=2795800 RepID=UPI003CCC02C6
MQRRDALKQLGMGAAGVGLGVAAASQVDAQDHGHAESKMPPVEHINLYFCGFHMAKSNPKFQLETQHYCCAHGDEMHQCVLYDKSTPDAKLLGVEYIITDKMYRELPEEEKKYWHPHTYEVLGGGLIAPHMSQEEEDAFMKALLPTWGKAWHVWPDPTTKVPMGDPLLMWSLMGDGQANEEMEAARDKQFGVDSQEIAERRQKLFDLPKPDVPLPTNMDFIGRQWTAEGPDTAAARKKELG